MSFAFPSTGRDLHLVRSDHLILLLQCVHLLLSFCKQIVISIYEVIYVFVRGAGVNTNFEPWAKHLIVLNTLLVVFNSSINFAFYCGDVVFRECLQTITGRCGKYFGGGGGGGGSGGGNGSGGGRRTNNNQVTRVSQTHLATFRRNLCTD